MKKWHLPLVVTAVIAAAVLGYTLRPQNVAPQAAKPVTQAQKAPEKPQPVVPSADTIYDLVNDYRMEHGVAPLKHLDGLDKSAAEKCQDMVSGSYFAHTNPVSGIKGTDLAKQYAPTMTYIGENLEYVHGDPSSAVVARWIKSPGHLKNIVDAKYTYTSVVVCAAPNLGNDYFYAVQHFAS